MIGLNEKLNKHIVDTINHKQLVLESASILCKYLLENDEPEKALALIRRCAVHDNSKFSDEEITAFTSLNEDISNLKNPKAKLDEIKKRLITIHWKNNRHHPEYFSDINEMTEIDIMEMACDCHARSIEYSTDLLEFVEIRQKERFNLPQHIYDTYYKYCQILLTNSKGEKIKKRDTKK